MFFISFRSLKKKFFNYFILGMRCSRVLLYCIARLPFLFPFSNVCPGSLSSVLPIRPLVPRRF